MDLHSYPTCEVLGYKRNREKTGQSAYEYDRASFAEDAGLSSASRMAEEMQAYIQQMCDNNMPRKFYKFAGGSNQLRVSQLWSDERVCT